MSQQALTEEFNWACLLTFMSIKPTPTYDRIITARDHIYNNRSPLTSLSFRAKKPSLCVLTDTLARSGRGTLAFTWPVLESARTTFFLVSRKIRAVPFEKKRAETVQAQHVNMPILCQKSECADRNVFLSAFSFSGIFEIWTGLGEKTSYTCPDMSAACWNKNNASC